MMKLSDQKCLHVLVLQDIWDIREKRTERYPGRTRVWREEPGYHGPCNKEHSDAATTCTK